MAKINAEPGNLLIIKIIVTLHVFYLLVELLREKVDSR